MLARYLSKELGPRGIHVNTAARGPIETNFGDVRNPNNPEMKKQNTSIANAGQVREAYEVGPMIASLPNDDLR